MSRDTINATLLGGCLFGAVVVAVALPSPLRLVLALVFLGAAGFLAHRILRHRAIAPRATAASPTPDERRNGIRRLLNGIEIWRPKTRAPKIDPALAALRQELDEQRKLNAELATRLAESDGVRRSMWLTLDGRLTALETAQQKEVAQLRQSQRRYHRDVDRLSDRVEAHKRELAALTQVLDETEHTLTKAAAGF